MTGQRENMRHGFTTGACATAASKAALLALLHQELVAQVEILLPRGERVAFAIHRCTFTQEEATVTIIKDAGDDPDVTHLAEIGSRVFFTKEPGISIRGGVGVGRVTKAGLPIPPGEPAINPVPRKMITAVLQEVLDEAGLTSTRVLTNAATGIAAEIFVPRGEELARKTFNPRLGIVGGISILGTTGIVVPYSTAAWWASIEQGIDVAIAQGHRHLVLSVGARGEQNARAFFPDLPEDAFVQIGPFFGDALRCCAAKGIAKISLVAMIGKLAKFAAGNESVHSTVSSQDFAFLREIAEAAGVGPQELAKITTANTAQEVAELMDAMGNAEFFRLLCVKAATFAQSLVKPGCEMRIILTGRSGEALGQWS